MDPNARVGQVWWCEESVELIVSGRMPEGRITEMRWNTFVLWSPDARDRRFDQAGESAFQHAEARDDVCYSDWHRIA